MKKLLYLALLTTLLLAALIGGGSAQAQGTVPAVNPVITGTLGQNGWYVSTVTVSFPNLDPTWVIVEGCQTVIIDFDTGPEGEPVTCIVRDINGTAGGGTGTIKRDATPPALQLISPAQPQVSANEGSTLALNAQAQDANLVTSGWDLDGDGTIDAPNPTSITVPGLQGGISPCFLAIDAAGNTSQLEVTVSSLNLAPTIDGWVVPTMIHFGGTLAISATVSDPGGDPLTGSLDWGDGSVEPVVIQPDGSLQAAHSYVTNGNYPLTLTIADGEGGIVSDTRHTVVHSPIETIEDELISGTLSLVGQGILNEGQANSLVVKLEGTVVALHNDRPSAPNKLNAYLNEYAAVVPNGSVTPCFLVATDVHNALVLHGWVIPPT